MLSKDKLNSLRRLDKTKRSVTDRPESLWDLIRSIHAMPTTRAWVTLESQPLRPFAEYVSDGADSSNAIIHLLLSTKLAKNDDSYRPPWAYLAWKWPSMQLLAMVDLRGVQNTMDDKSISNDCCSKSFAESVENALKEGNPIPLPEDPLYSLYRRTIDGFSYFLPQRVCSQPASESPSHAATTVRDSEPIYADQNHPGQQSRSTSTRQVDLRLFLDQTRRLITEIGQKDLLAELRQIQSSLYRPFFSVAVVGEFSRGKSTLINRLLDRDVLPVGDVPTTAMLTRLMFGPNEGITWIGRNGQRSKLPFSKASWEELIARDDGKDPEGVVQVELAEPWLHESGIQIVDTPGAGDLVGTRAALVADAVATCDAAVVAISATMAMSLTERSFIEQNIIAKEVPRVAVVITRLYQVKATDRSTVIRHVQDDLSTWAPGTPVWIYQKEGVDREQIQIDTMDVSGIRAQLEVWAKDSHLIERRVGQAIAGLRELLLIVQDTTQKKLDVAKLTEEEQLQFRETEEERLRRSHLDWEDLRLEMEKREIACADWLEKTVHSMKGEMFECLQFQLSKSANARAWWEKDLPYLLRKELQRTARSLDDSLQRRIAGDAARLVARAEKMFSWMLSVAKPIEVFESKQASIQALGDDISDADKMRLKSRVVAGVMTAGAYLLLGPIGIVAGVGSMAVMEKLSKDELERQQSRLDAPLDDAITKTLADSTRTARGRLKEIYAAILRELTEKEELWAHGQRDAFAHSKNATAGDMEKWSSDLKRIDDFLKQLPPTYAE